jgi:hypothetical protein
VVDLSVPKLLPGFLLFSAACVYGIAEGGLGGFVVAVVSGALLAMLLSMMLSRYPVLELDDSGVSIRGIWIAWEEIDYFVVYEAPLPWIRDRVLLFHADPETLLQRDPARWRRWLRRRRTNPRARTAFGTPLMFMNRRRKQVLDAVDEYWNSRSE